MLPAVCKVTEDCSFFSVLWYFRQDCAGQGEWCESGGSVGAGFRMLFLTAIAASLCFLSPCGGDRACSWLTPGSLLGMGIPKSSLQRNFCTWCSPWQVWEKFWLSELPSDVGYQDETQGHQGISGIARHSLSNSVIPRDSPAALKSTEIKHERPEDLASRRVDLSPIVNHCPGLLNHELLRRNPMFLER